MVSGGTRFARRGRPRPAPRVVDAEVRPPHKTLYEVLVVPPATSSRQIRRIARALRHNLPNLADLDDVCLAEQVLGRRELRAEYDALLARARAAKLTLPQIGAAIEGSRPGAAAADPVPPPVPRPAPFSSVGSVGRARADSSDQSVKILLRVGAAAAVLIIGAVGKSGKHDSDRYRMPEIRPIQVPRVEPLKIDIPKFELPRTELPRIDPHELGVDKIDPARPEPARSSASPDRIEPPRHKPPRPPAKPRKPDPAPPETP